MKQVLMWSVKRNRLTIHPIKTEAMILRKSAFVGPLPPLYFGTGLINLVDSTKRGHKLFFWWINSRDGLPTSATQPSLFLPKRESHVLQQRMVQYLEPRLGVRLNYITCVTYVFVS